MNNYIQINNLKYDNTFKDFCLNIKENQFTTISGPNCSGKTTLLRILNREKIVNDTIIIDNKYINKYKIDEYINLIQCVIPLEIIFQEKTVIEELYMYNNDKNIITKIVKGFKIKKIINKKIKELKQEEIIIIQLAIAIISNPKILLIDDLSPYFNENKLDEIIILLKQFQEKKNMTIIYTTINLQQSLITDYLYIINESKIVLEGKPIEVLEKDNIINKIGLNVPFMIDLSVKLRDYDLIEDIELNTERMVDKLWK